MKLNLFKSKVDTHAEIEGVVRFRIDEVRLSAANAEQLKRHYIPKVVGQETVVLELSSLKFIDSSGLGLLVGLRNAMNSPKKVVLEGLSDPTLIELIRLTRMDQIFVLSTGPKETQALLSH